MKWEKQKSGNEVIELNWGYISYNDFDNPIEDAINNLFPGIFDSDDEQSETAIVVMSEDEPPT